MQRIFLCAWRKTRCGIITAEKLGRLCKHSASIPSNLKNYNSLLVFSIYIIIILLSWQNLPLSESILIIPRILYLLAFSFTELLTFSNMRRENDKNFWKRDWWIEMRMEIIHYFEKLFEKVLLIWTHRRVDIFEKYDEK